MIRFLSIGFVLLPLKILLLCGTSVSEGSAFDIPDVKTFDYPEKPSIEVDYKNLDARLEIGFEGRVIEGMLTYTIEPRHSYVDQFTWAAPGIEIMNFSVDGAEGDFIPQEDSMKIVFDDYLAKGETVDIALTYRADPVFGVHVLATGTIFSSRMPGSVSHWLPGPVFPGVSIPLALRLTVPDGMMAVATGEPGQEGSDESGSYYTFDSRDPVPLSEIGFAVGDFELQETFSGTRNLRLYFENELLEDEQSRDILDHMAQKTRNLERFVRSGLPLPAFHVVVLKDGRWETRPYAAGMGFLAIPERKNQRAERKQADQNKVMISRSIAAQWFGISVRPEQWSSADFIQLFQALVAEETEENTWYPENDELGSAFDIPGTVYDKLDMKSWQLSREFIQKQSDPVLIDALTDMIRDIGVSNNVYTNQDFSSQIYGQTGRWIAAPDVKTLETASDRPVHYSAEITQVGVSNDLRIVLDPYPEPKVSEQTLKIRLVRDGRYHEKKIKFNAAGDTVNVSIDQAIHNVNLRDDANVRFTTEKPFEFWLHQLRRDEDPDLRREAAQALIDFSDDPDLQLAIQDIIRREDNHRVLAAMYALLAELTDGASGTENRFLEGVESNHSEIRNVSMQALSAYTGKSLVKDRVFSLIQGSDDIPLVNTAISTYRHLIDEDDFRDFAHQFLHEDRDKLLFTQTLMEELFELPVREASVDVLQEYLNKIYPFVIRWTAYRLLRNKASDAGWQREFLENFSDDPDPRIRFLTIFSSSELNSEDKGPFFERRMLKDYDIRILKRLRDHYESE